MSKQTELDACKAKLDEMDKALASLSANHIKVIEQKDTQIDELSKSNMDLGRLLKEALENLQRAEETVSATAFVIGRLGERKPLHGTA